MSEHSNSSSESQPREENAVHDEASSLDMEHAAYDEAPAAMEDTAEAEANDEDNDEDTAVGRRSATRPPEDDTAPAALAPAPLHSMHVYNTHSNNELYTPGGGGQGNNNQYNSSRRRSSAAGSGAAPVSSSRVRRSSSLLSGIRTGDGRNIVIENHDSLTPDPTVQELRRQSIIAASRYRSARRASSLSNAIGVRGDAGTPRRGSRSGSIASARSQPRLTPAEAEAMELIAANDMRRVETYERAKELEVERECYVLDAEIDKHVKAEDNYVKKLNERNAAMEKKRVERERRMEEAWRRRNEQEDAKRRLIEDKIAQREREVPYDPYSTLVVKRRYSAPLVRGGSSNGSTVITPHRRASGPRSDNNNGSSINDDQRQGNGRTSRRGSATRQRSGSVIVEHPRGWR